MFLPLQPNDKLNDFLNMADVHLVIQKSNAADLVLPSKLTNILSVGGLAVITADKGSGFYNLINDHQVGMLCSSENTDALSGAINRALVGDHYSTKPMHADMQKLTSL